MSDYTTRSARLGGELNERFEDYKDRHDMTVSEAGRHLIRTGLEVEEGDDEEQREVKVAQTGDYWWQLGTHTGSVLASLSVAAVLAHFLTTLGVSAGFVLSLAVATIVVNAAAYHRGEQTVSVNG